MKILIIGANSYVGARIYFELSKKYQVIGTYNSFKLSDKFIQLDITKKNKVEQLILQQKPDIVIHVANNANPRWCEANREAAIKLNKDSTNFIVKAANLIKAKLIHLSSIGAVEAVNIYAKTKSESEKFVKQTTAGYLILQPSLILGFSPNMINDRPFNRLLKNLDQGTPAVYDTSWKFQPSYIGHICEILEIIIKRNLWNETIPIMVEGLKSRYETARDILTPFGVKVEPIDNHDLLPVIKQDLSKLKQLNLPLYSYSQMIIKIIDEIRHREHFKI